MNQSVSQTLTDIECGKCLKKYTGLTPGPASSARLTLYGNRLTGVCGKCITVGGRIRFEDEVLHYYHRKATGQSNGQMNEVEG